jgi:hypothetical protein
MSSSAIAATLHNDQMMSRNIRYRKDIMAINILLQSYIAQNMAAPPIPNTMPVMRSKIKAVIPAVVIATL